MNADKWQKIEMLCYETEEMERAERDTYLQNACGGDNELLTEVKSLLNQSDSNHLQQPFVVVESSFIFSDEQPMSEQTIGPYRLIKTIGSGGMGQVYLAVRDDEEFERFVALKVIHRTMVSDDVLKRFYEERQILASLNHPNIARLFDGGTAGDGTPWFAMEYIEGKPITDYCRQHNLTVDKKIELFLSVCLTVQYAHQNLVIHRDLKPANIIITRDGKPKLLDFGIAKLKNLGQKAGQTQYHNQLLTPEYASPEQVRNDPISTASDVYALGVLLYEMLTGQLPYEFEQRTPATIERTVCNTIPKQPSSTAGKKVLKGDLDSIILMALRKSPTERYASVEQLANDLERHQKSLPIVARKQSIGYRAQKFLARHKWGAAASAAVALLIIAFAVVTYIQSQTIQERVVEAERQRDRAEQVSTFLTDLFESVDPNKAENRSLSAIELLHRGTNRVETELSDQPGHQANVYLVISDVYESLGLFDEGLDLAQKAYVLQQELYNAPHPEMARSLNAMGWLFRQKGNYIKADSLLNVALAMRRVLYGSEHLDVARSLNDLAVLKQSRGDYAATDTLLQKAIEIRKALEGDHHESVAVALSNYAALKYRLGDLPGAEQHMREALHIFEQTVGDEDMRTANVMTNLAAILLTQKDTTDVEQLYRKALNMRLQLLGEEHPDVASSYSHLGNLLRAKGEYNEAEIMLMKALNLRRKLLGENHVSVGVSKRVLGFLYEDMGNYAEAESYYLGAINIFRRMYPEAHARTAGVLHMLGELYLRKKSPNKAEQPLREALDMRKQVFGDNDYRTAVSKINLGLCLAGLGEENRARSLLSSGLKIIQGSDEENFSQLIEKAEKIMVKR